VNLISEEFAKQNHVDRAFDKAEGIPKTSQLVSTAACRAKQTSYRQNLTSSLFGD